MNERTHARKNEMKTLKVVDSESHMIIFKRTMRQRFQYGCLFHI